MLSLSQRQKSELVTAIKGRGEIPLKFVYMGEKGAKRWNKVANVRGSASVRGINSVEGDLLKDKIPDLLSSFKKLTKLNIVDIGCGNGYSALPVLDFLAIHGIPFHYVPVDISKELLDLAKANVQKKFPGLRVTPRQLDFELGNFADLTHELRGDGSSNLLLFLGSTLGNQADRYRVLTNFRDSMTSDDYMIVGVELANLFKVDKILSHYQNREAKEFSFTTAEELGLKLSDGDFEVRFNGEVSQVEIYFKMRKEKILDLEGEEIILEKDDKLLLARSHKFTEWVFAKALSEVGLRIELLTTSPVKGYSLVMCQPTRFTY